MNKLLLLIAFVLCGLRLDAQTYYINENFNSLSAGSTVPSGWSNNLISGSSSFDFFRFGQSGVFNAVGNPGTRTSGNSSFSGICAIFDSDNTSSGGGLENVALETPAFNTTGAANVWVKWDQDYHGGYQSGDSINIEVFDGTTWTKVYQYGAFSTTGAAAIQNTPTVDVTSLIANKTGVKVRFRFRGNWSWWWMLDNVQVYSIPPTYYFIQEPFTTASGSTPPAGWSNNLMSGNSSYDFFRFGQSGVFNSVGNPGTRTTPNSNMAGTFAIFDSDNTSSGGGLENVALESPIAITSGFSSNIKLKWDQFYRGGYQSGDSIKVEVFDGTTWTMVYEYGAFATDGSAQITNSPDIDVTSLLANKTNARVRFRFRGNWSWWWLFDNVTLYAPAPTPAPDFTINNASQCLPGNSFSFTNTSTIAGSTSSMTYSWNFGDLTNSTATSPSGKTYASANTYTVTLTATSNLGVSASTSKTVTVNAVVTPSVSIAASPSNTVCANQSVTFTATPTNGGTAPTYQWKKNGNNIATGASWNAGTSLVTGDAITCVMTSNYPCPTGGISVVTSNTVNMTVNPVLTPSVSIAVSPSNSFCPGTNATFTATPTNGGSTPAYQWKKNGSNVGTNSTTYSDNTLTTGDVITCVMTSNIPCPTSGVATATSNGITINTSFPASVSIVASTPTTVCSGTSVTFTATPTNGGTPSYQWKKNGGNVGTNSNAFTDVPGNGDVYSVQMTSSIACASPKPATSNTITITHAVPVTPSVTVTSVPSGSICPGVAVGFTANPTNGGTAPSYQWKVNGNNVGTNSQYYSNTGTLNNGDVVSVVMTPNLCASPTTATGSKTMVVTPFTVPTISISANPGNAICSGTSVTFSATISNGGTSPVYQWKKNNVNVGTNSATYNAGTTLNNFDVITCNITSGATCPATTTSNSITMNVTPTLTPTVTVVASVPSPACQGVAVNFTANTTNVGPTPSYQWKLDGNNVGTNNAVFSNSGTLTPGAHTVNCVVTNSYSCPTASTAINTLNYTVTATAVPGVTITGLTGGNACQGASVTLTANPTNGGTAPTYQWKKNGNNVATGASWPAATSLITGDVVTVVMTSNAACTFPSPNVTSSPLNITVYPNATAALTVSSNAPGNSSCAGLPVIFTANPVNGGATPTYQWKKNSVNVGTNSPTYTDASLATGNTISCTMTTSQFCTTPASTSSNTITMTVNPIVIASITITANPDSVGCVDGPFSFTSFFTNGGSNPTYQWYKNGNPIQGSVQSVYSSNALADGDVISCKMASSIVCAFPVMSNSIGVHLTPTPKPTLTIVGLLTQTGGIAFTSNLTDPGTNPTYQWRKNSVDIAGATGPTYTTNKDELGPTDKINLFAHSSAACANPEFLLSNTVNVYEVTDINKVSSVFSDLSLFPNPNEGKFTVSGTVRSPGSTEASIEILNGIGQVVYRDAAKITRNELNAKIDIGSRITAGMYMIRITVGDQTESMRFIMK